MDRDTALGVLNEIYGVMIGGAIVLTFLPLADPSQDESLIPFLGFVVALFAILIGIVTVVGVEGWYMRRAYSSASALLILAGGTAVFGLSLMSYLALFELPATSNLFIIIQLGTVSWGITRWLVYILVPRIEKAAKKIGAF